MGGICLLALVLVSRTSALKGMVGVVDGALSSARFVSQAPLGRGEASVATIELQATPMRQIRDKDKPDKIRVETIRYQRFIQTLSTLGGRVEFRLSFRDGRGKVLISARGRGAKDELQQRLLAIVRAHPPEFKADISEAPPQTSGKASHCLRISGVPEAVENPLEPLSRYFIGNSVDGDYQVILEKVRGHPLRRLLARSEQKKSAEKSGGQKARQPTLQGEQLSSTVRDYAEEVRLEESMKQLERHHSSLALRCSIYVTAYADNAPSAALVARGASSMIVGALSSHRSASALKVTGVKGGMRQIGAKRRPTLMLPKEAVPYVWIPQMAMGGAIVPSAEFELPPKLEGEIQLGRIVVHSTPTAHEARMPIDTLVKHAIVVGMTGSGKSTTGFSLLSQLYQRGIPFLVIEPVKSEYRTLISTIPSLQVFTLGDEETAPFRLNIFDPPPGVKILTHMENLEAAWNASFVMYAPLPYVIKEVFAETYRACGWDLRNDKRGRPITLEDFRGQAERVSRRLGYEPKVTMDIEAALKTRITNLTLGGKGPLFNTIVSVPIEDILRRPTVIELKRIPNNEEKAFLAALILMNVVEYVETKGSSKQLRHVTLIEEAHRLLPNISTQKGDPESADPRKRMVEQFASMLAEVRAYGEGLVIVEQIPTKIIPDAIKNTATKIAHRVPAADDREVLAGAMNLTKEQATVFTALQPGEAILSVEKHALPIKVVVPNIIERTGMPVGEIGDEEVRRHMADYYLRNPLPKEPPHPLDAMILPTVDTDWFKAKFLETYGVWQKTGDIPPLRDLIVGAAKKYSKSDDETLTIAGRILSMAVRFYLPFDEEDRIKFPRLFMRSVERSMRDGKKE